MIVLVLVLYLLVLLLKLMLIRLCLNIVFDIVRNNFGLLVCMVIWVEWVWLSFFMMLGGNLLLLVGMIFKGYCIVLMRVMFEWWVLGGRCLCFFIDEL